MGVNPAGPFPSMNKIAVHKNDNGYPDRWLPWTNSIVWSDFRLKKDQEAIGDDKKCVSTIDEKVTAEILKSLFGFYQSVMV